MQRPIEFVHGALSARAIFAAAALEAMAAARADGVVTVGGGSTIGLGKYIAAKTGRPFVAVPTTFSGSEMTPLYGLKIGLEKRTWVDPAAKPRTVIYDPELVASLPTHEAVTTGMNGLAHCIEALYPAVPNPLARLMALEGIAAFADGLRGITSRNDEVSHSCALYGGFIGGLLVSMVGAGLHHRICHVLGGRFGVPHGESNSVILPHVTAFNAPFLAQDAAAIARAMNRTGAELRCSNSRRSSEYRLAYASSACQKISRKTLPAKCSQSRSIIRARSRLKPCDRYLRTPGRDTTMWWSRRPVYPQGAHRGRATNENRDCRWRRIRARPRRYALPPSRR